MAEAYAKMEESNKDGLLPGQSNDGDGTGERSRVQSLDQIHMDLDEYDGLEQEEVQGWLNRSLDKPNDAIKDAITALRRGTSSDTRPASLRYKPQVFPRPAVAPPIPKLPPITHTANSGMPPVSPRSQTPRSAGRPSPRSGSKPSAIPRPSPRTPKPNQTPRTVPYVEAPTVNAVSPTKLTPPASLHHVNGEMGNQAMPSGGEPTSLVEEQARREREAMVRIYDPFLQQSSWTPEQPPASSLPGTGGNAGGLTRHHNEVGMGLAVHGTPDPMGDESPETSFVGGQHVRTGSWPALGMMDAVEVDTHMPHNNGGTYLQSNALFTAAQLSQNPSPRESVGNVLNAQAPSQQYLPAGSMSGASPPTQSPTNIPVASMDSNSMYKTLMANVQMLVQAIHHKKAKEDLELNYLNHLVRSAIPASGASESPEWSPFGPTPRGSTGASQAWRPQSTHRASTGDSTPQQQPGTVHSTSTSLAPWQAQSSISSANSSFLVPIESGAQNGYNVDEVTRKTLWASLEAEVPPTPRHRAGDYSKLVLSGGDGRLNDTSFYSAHNHSTMSSPMAFSSSSPLASTPRVSETGSHPGAMAMSGDRQTERSDGRSSLNASDLGDESKLSASTSLLLPTSMHASVELSQTYQFMLDEAQCAAAQPATTLHCHKSSHSAPVGGFAGELFDGVSSHLGNLLGNESNSSIGYQAMEGSDVGEECLPAALSRSSSAISMWDNRQHRSSEQTRDMGDASEAQTTTMQATMSRSSPNLAFPVSHFDTTALDNRKRLSDWGGPQEDSRIADSQTEDCAAGHSSVYCESKAEDDMSIDDATTRFDCGEHVLDRSGISHHSQHSELLRAEEEEENEDSTSTGTIIVRDECDECEDHTRPLAPVGNFCPPPAPLCPAPWGNATIGFFGRRQGHSRATSHAHSRRSTSSTVDCASTGRALSLIDMAEPLTSSIDLAPGLLSNEFDDDFLDRALPDADIERTTSAGALAAFLKAQALPELQQCPEPALPGQEELENSVGNVLESLLVDGEVTSSGLPVVREQSPRPTRNAVAHARRKEDGSELVTVSVDATDGTSTISPRDVVALVKEEVSKGGSPTKHGAFPIESTRLRRGRKGIAGEKKKRPGFFKRLFTCHCAYIPEETV